MEDRAKNSRATPNVKAACEECRSRKTKCDGVRPSCTRCSKKSKPCVYDAEPDEYRATALRRKCKMWENQALAGERLLLALRDLPEDESVNILRRLRQRENVEDILDSLISSDLQGDERRGRTPSDAASHCSAGSAATSSGSAQEGQSQLAGMQGSQQVDFAMTDNQCESPGHNRSQNRLAIDFLVNRGDETDPTNRQQAHRQNSKSAVGSSHSFNRKNSFPPVTQASVEARRRISAPVPVGSDSGDAIAQASREVSPTTNGQASAPGQSTDWDRYYTTVSRLMKKIGEGSDAPQQ